MVSPSGTQPQHFGRPREIVDTRTPFPTGTSSFLIGFAQTEHMPFSSNAVQLAYRSCKGQTTLLSRRIHNSRMCWCRVASDASAAPV